MSWPGAQRPGRADLGALVALAGHDEGRLAHAVEAPDLLVEHAGREDRAVHADEVVGGEPELGVAVVQVQHRQVVGGGHRAAGAAGQRLRRSAQVGPIRVARTSMSAIVGSLGRRQPARAPAHPSRVDPALGQQVGGRRGGDPLRVGEVEHAEDGVVDPPDALLGTGPIVATLLLGDVDHSAGVHHVVGRVQHTGVGDPLGILRRGELVVGRSDHRRRAQLRDRGRPTAHAPRAHGRVDVARDGVGRARRAPRRRRCARRPRRRRPARTSATVSRAPSAWRWSASAPPTLPTPLMHDVAARERRRRPRAARPRPSWPTAPRARWPATGRRSRRGAR